MKPRLAVTLETPLALDEDWQLVSRLRAGDIFPVTETDRDRCRVTVLNFDMTERIVVAARDVVRRLGPEADQAISRIDVRPHFEEWWSVIARPIQLSDDVWLRLDPEAVGRGPILGSGSRVQTALTLRARPRVVLADSIPAVERAPLPALEFIEPEEGMRIFAEARAEYDELARLITDEVRDLEMSASGRTLRVREVEIQGVGDGRLSIRLEVDGDVKGELYLVGTPVYDPQTGQVAVPDLEFDISTREALVSGAAWVARVGLIETFRTSAQWPASPAVDWARSQVEAGFNSRLSADVRLEGSVEDVSVHGVAAGLDALLVRAEVTGTARLIVEANR